MRSRTGLKEKAQGVSASDRTDKRGWRERRTRRNVAAATLLVYASTFLWMTASFAGTEKPPGGAAWTLATVGALVSLALFTLAAWGLFKSTSWWERVASAGAIAGLAALVPYGVAASSTGVSGPGLNSAIHITGSAAVLLVLLVPALERRMQAWLSGEGRRGRPEQASPWAGTDPRRR
jgi:peptidoglycan/LPS O-acetylase OafA/YrhL